MPKLNKPQRILLACVAVLILVFQFYKFMENGVEGSGWVLSLVSAGVLLLPAFGMLSARATTTQTASGGAAEFNSLIARRSRTQTLFNRAKSKSGELQNSILSWLGLPDVPKLVPEFAQIDSLMKDQWLQYCLAYVVSLATIAEFKRDPKFLDGDEFKILWAQTGKHMLALAEESATRNGLADKFNHESAKTWMFRDLNECRGAMNAFISSISSNAVDPDAQLIAFLMKKLGVPDARKQQFSEQARKFTKQTLSEFASA